MKIVAPRPLSAIARFLRKEDASMSIEAALMLPMLIGIYVAGYQFFDSYRREAQMFKASYAVADILSRRLSLLSRDDLNGLERVYETMTFSENESYMRFSEVRRTNDGVEVVWSYATDGQTALTNRRLQGFLDQIPVLALNERVTIVESFTFEQPFFDVGLDARIVENFVPVSQRYAARLAFAPGDGTEDQPSVNNNNIDCGDDVVEIAGEILIGAGNCTEVPDDGTPTGSG